MNAPRDSSCLSGERLAFLAENRSRLADRILFYRYVHYSDIEERVAPGLEVDLLKRCIDLNKIKVNRPVQNIQRFLDLLKNCKSIVELQFDSCDQPQDLFDRLPEHCAVQKLSIDRSPSDLASLFRLKHLIHLEIHRSIDSETVRRAFDELPALASLRFRCDHKTASIRIDPFNQHWVSVDSNEEATASDLNAAIEFIFGNQNE